MSECGTTAHLMIPSFTSLKHGLCPLLQNRGSLAGQGAYIHCQGHFRIRRQQNWSRQSFSRTEQRGRRCFPKVHFRVDDQRFTHLPSEKEMDIGAVVIDLTFFWYFRVPCVGLDKWYPLDPPAFVNHFYTGGTISMKIQ